MRASPLSAIPQRPWGNQAKGILHTTLGKWLCFANAMALVPGITELTQRSLYAAPRFLKGFW
jgi:hypothetical protein